jgi:uncharacterized protein
MKSLLAAFGSGALFAIGLAISGMTKPSKVIGFLDVGGAWDASLAFVMIGAIGVHFVAQRLRGRFPTPLFGDTFHLPSSKHIDARLVVGAALFGVGWGLGGFCPGPGIVTAGSGSAGALVFVAGMTLGMFAEHATTNALARHARAG